MIFKFPAVSEFRRLSGTARAFRKSDFLFLGAGVWELDLCSQPVAFAFASMRAQESLLLTGMTSTWCYASKCCACMPGGCACCFVGSAVLWRFGGVILLARAVLWRWGRYRSCKPVAAMCYRHVCDAETFGRKVS